MYTEGYDQWFKLDKNFTGPLTEWNKATTDRYKHVTEQNVELISENFSRLSEQLKRLTHTKKPGDLITLQNECFNENMTASIECFQKLVHTSMENMEAFTRLFKSLQNHVTTNKSSEHSQR